MTLTYDKAGNLRTSAVASGPTTTYTHDCWNRLVKVAVTPSGGSASTRAKYEYNGLTWRTRKLSDSDLSAQSGDSALDEERVMSYSANWQLLEERIDRNYQSDAGLNARTQHVWGLRYIDDVVLHRRDEKQGSTAPDGDYADTNEGTWYHLTDAQTYSQFSTVCVMRPSGDVIERVSYSAYGEARHHLGADVTGDGAADGSDVGEILSGWGTSIGDAGYRSEADLDRDGQIGSADYGLVLAGWGAALASGEISLRTASGPDGVIGWDGYVFDAETKSYKVRFRDYEPVLGRWRQRDPLGHVEGMSLYQYVSSNPITSVDPIGQDGMDLKFDQQLKARRFRPSVAWEFVPLDADAVACYEWASKEAARENALGKWHETLPACPCTINDPCDAGVWGPLEDGRLQSWPFNAWTIYHPAGTYQRRSVPSRPGGIGQQCIYDQDGRLITGGRSVGTPDLVSPIYPIRGPYNLVLPLTPPWATRRFMVIPYAYPDLQHVGAHRDLDVDPFEACRRAGLLSLYHKYRPPNNGPKCPRNEKD